MKYLNKIFLIFTLLSTIVLADTKDKKLFCEEEPDVIIEYCKKIKKFSYKNNSSEVMLAVPENIEIYDEIDDVGRTLSKSIHNKIMYQLNKRIIGIFTNIKKKYKTVDVSMKSVRWGKSRKTLNLSNRLKKTRKKSENLLEFYKFYDEYAENFLEDLMVVNNAKGIFFPEIASDIEELSEALDDNGKYTLLINLNYYNLDKGLTTEFIDVNIKKIKAKRYKVSNIKKISNLILDKMGRLLNGKMKEKESLDEDF